MKLEFFELEVIRIALNFLINTNKYVHQDYIESAEWLRKKITAEQEKLVEE